MTPATLENETPVDDAPAVDPLDIPYRESGLEQPLYYCAHLPPGGGSYYVHERDEHGRSQLVYIGHILGGVYHYRTPREEQYVRDDISRRLNGNSPDRWKGNNLDEDDEFVCAECTFRTRNTKVGTDHRRKLGHTPRLN